MKVSCLKFKFLRAPYGVSSIYLNITIIGTDEAFSGLSGYRCIVNDIVIYDSDEKLPDLHVRQFLQCCRITLNTLNNSKWEYEVDFAGFILSADGYRVNGASVNQLSASTSQLSPLTLEQKKPIIIDV